MRYIVGKRVMLKKIPAKGIGSSLRRYTGFQYTSEVAVKTSASIRSCIVIAYAVIVFVCKIVPSAVSSSVGAVSATATSHTAGVAVPIITYAVPVFIYKSGTGTIGAVITHTVIVDKTDGSKTGASSLCIKPRWLCGKQNGRNYHADYHHYTNSYYFFHKTSIAQ